MLGWHLSVLGLAALFFCEKLGFLDCIGMNSYFFVYLYMHVGPVLFCYRVTDLFLSVKNRHD